MSHYVPLTFLSFPSATSLFELISCKSFSPPASEMVSAKHEQIRQCEEP